VPETCIAPQLDTEDLNNLTMHIILDNPLPHNAAAAKAKFDCPMTDELHRQLQQLNITLNIFAPAVSEQIALTGSHPTAGLAVEPHKDYSDTVIFKRFEPGTHAHKSIQRWKSCLTGSIIQLIDDEDVYTAADVVRILSENNVFTKVMSPYNLLSQHGQPHQAKASLPFNLTNSMSLRTTCMSLTWEKSYGTTHSHGHLSKMNPSNWQF
jgi:hypothetical protein